MTAVRNDCCDCAVPGTFEVHANENISVVQEIEKEIDSNSDFKKENNAVSQSEKDATVMPDIQLGLHQTEAESEVVKEFNVADILANDPYYDDVPLEDKGEIRTPIDKENLKKAILIVLGALIFVSAITALLVATS